MFMLNLALARRLMRAKFPSLGFHLVCSVLFWGLYALCVVGMIIVLVVIIQTLFTMDSYTTNFDREVQICVLTTFAVISFLPLPIAVAAFFRPDFTMGFFAYYLPIARASLLLVATSIACLGSAYCCGVTWLDPVPLIHPKPKYMHTACFYTFYFVLTLLSSQYMLLHV